MEPTAALLDVLAPLSGVRVALERVPDPVFAQRLVGDGASLDPTSNTLLAPIAGRVVQLHSARHALTVRSVEGIELLIHIGIDTVQLAGEGFEALVAVGDAVRVGQPLIRFDLDRVGCRARSLLTQVLVANMDAVASLELGRGALVAGTSSLFRLRLRAAAVVPVEPLGETLCSEPQRLPNRGGLHARPAARVAETARRFHAEVMLRLGVAKANAKSVVALLGLQARQGDAVLVEARGPEAAAALQAVAELLASGCGDDDAPVPGRPIASSAPEAATGLSESQLRGVAAAPGFAVGPVAHLHRARVEVDQYGDDRALERERLREALHQAGQDLARLRSGLSDATRAGILEAHGALLDDPELRAAAEAGIDRGETAGYAWRAAFEAHAAILAGLSDPLLRERAVDLRDVGERVLRLLVGDALPPLRLPEGCIVIAEDLNPSDTAQFDRDRVRGLCTRDGGPTGHVAILARALGIPMLCGIDAAALQLPEGQTVVLDAERSLLDCAPDAAAIAAAERRRVDDAARRQAAQDRAQALAYSRDGQRIEVVANVRDAADARAAIAAGAEGVGLLRSEFLFQDRSQAPSEDQQAEAYQAVARELGVERPLVIRTLDVGGDKPLSYLPLPVEDNPFLGLRGLRVSLAQPALFRSQLRALLRCADAAKLHVMLPMVSSLAELRSARSLLQEEASDLGVAMPALGIMIEVPSAALLAEHFAREVEFFSIGSNDLTQYTLAIDRGHAQLAAQADALDPAVLRLMAMSCEAAVRHGRWVGLCGALASDPLAVPLLLGLGITELSVSAPAVAAVKAAVAAVSMTECRALADEALQLDSAAAVRVRLQQFQRELDTAAAPGALARSELDVCR